MLTNRSSFQDHFDSDVTESDDIWVGELFTLQLVCLFQKSDPDLRNVCEHDRPALSHWQSNEPDSVIASFQVNFHFNLMRYHT